MTHPELTITQLREAEDKLRQAINDALSTYHVKVGNMPRAIRMNTHIHRGVVQDQPRINVQTMYTSIEIDPPHY